MQPTNYLADPAIRLSGIRFSAPRWRVEAPARAVGMPSRLRLPWGPVALTAIALIAVCTLGVLRTWPPLATVMSGSMAPTINTATWCCSRSSAGPARIGDVVKVSVPAEARNRFGYPPVVIHRIVRIDAHGAVTTKGDAFEKEDPFTVPSSALSTKVVATVPAAGRVFAFLGTVQSATDELRVVTAAFTAHLELLPAQIEKAVWAAIATSAPAPAPPPPPVPRPPARLMAASAWKPPTPDLMAVLRAPARPTGGIFSRPANFSALTT